MNTNDTRQIAICGCGFIAAHHARRISDSIPGMRIRACWDRYPDAAEKLRRECKADYCAADIGEIANDPLIDAVYICTTHHYRLPIVETMAKSGKAIFSEKPLTHSRETLGDLFRILARHPVLFQSGYKIRFHSGMKHAMELMPCPELVSAQVTDFCWEENEMNNPATGGGNVLSQGTYATESIRLMARGLPVSVTASAITGKGHPDRVNALCAVYEFESGVLGQVMIGDTGQAPQPVSKFCVQASGGNRSIALLSRYRHLVFRDSDTGNEEEFSHPEDGFLAQSRSFLKALNGEATIECDFHEGAIPSIMIYAAIDSARSGTKQPIDINKCLER